MLIMKNNKIIHAITLVMYVQQSITLILWNIFSKNVTRLLKYMGILHHWARIFFSHVFRWQTFADIYHTLQYFFLWRKACDFNFECTNIPFTITSKEPRRPAWQIRFVSGCSFIMYFCSDLHSRACATHNPLYVKKRISNLIIVAAIMHSPMLHIDFYWFAHKNLYLCRISDTIDFYSRK